MKMPNEDIRKITVNLPAKLIDPLIKASGQGPTELFTELLRKEKNRRAWQALSELRGKIPFEMTWQQLRDKDGDRDLAVFLTQSPENT